MRWNKRDTIKDGKAYNKYFESKLIEFTGVAQEATSQLEVPSYQVYSHPFLKLLTAMKFLELTVKVAKQSGAPNLVSLCGKLTLATRGVGADAKYLF